MFPPALAFKVTLIYHCRQFKWVQYCKNDKKKMIRDESEEMTSGLTEHLASLVEGEEQIVILITAGESMV